MGGAGGAGTPVVADGTPVRFTFLPGGGRGPLGPARGGGGGPLGFGGYGTDAGY